MKFKNENASVYFPGEESFSEITDICIAAHQDDIEIMDVYSDSIKHDKPIFSLGKNCYHIVKGKKVPFEFKNIYG